MDKLHAALAFSLLGMPIWLWLVLTAVGGVNELVNRMKWTKAESLIQGAARAILWVPAVGPTLGRFPLLGTLLRWSAGLEKQPVIGSEIGGPSNPAVVLVMLSAFMGVSGCASLFADTYAGLATAERVVGAANDQFPGLDKAHRKQLTDKAASLDEGKKALAAWDLVADKLAKTIQGTDATVKLCRDAVAEIKAGTRDKAQLSGWIATGLRLGLDLKDLLSAAGLKLEVK